MRAFKIMLALLLVCSANKSIACSAFTMKSSKRVIMAKSYDWSVGNGVVLTNPRGEREAIPVGGSETFKWTALYGSVTFNQYGQYMPNGGINEAGLAIEVLWLDETHFPKPETKKLLNELQWVQYHLDCFSTVVEVVKSNEEISIVPIFGKLHYYIADRQGNSAVIEFVNGERVIHYGESMQCKGITNDTYKLSIDYQEAKIAKSKSVNSSLSRFTRIYDELKNHPEIPDEQIVDKSFTLLQSVWTSNWTKWNIVYDLTNLVIYFKSSTANANKEIQLKNLDFASSATPVFIDINTFYSDDVSKSVSPFTNKINYELIYNSIKLTGIELPQKMMELMANLPNSIKELSDTMASHFSKVGNIVVNISGLKNGFGSVNIGLFNSEEGFKKQHPFNGGRVRVINGTAHLVIYNVPLDTEYAIGYYYDQNGNNKLDFNFLGIPKERYGFSGKGRRKFEKAKFNLSQKELQVVI